MKTMIYKYKTKQIKNINILSGLMLSVLIFLTSCEGDFKHDLKIDGYTQQLVVNCTFTNDSTWKLNVSKTAGILDDESWEPVNDAIVTITNKNETTFVLNNNDKGCYSFEQAPVCNELYDLRINIPGYKTIEASDYLPSPVFVESVSFKDSVAFDEELCLSESVLSFNDNETETNYYQIIFYQVDDNNRRVSLLTSTDDISAENSANNSVTNSVTYWDYIVENDVFFNGGNHKIAFRFSKVFPEKDVYVELRSLSADLHEYVLTYIKYLMNTGDPFVEPISVYSNVVNGLGIFGGYTSGTVKLKTNN